MREVELRALIFDVDGTLADTERDGHRVAFNAAFAERGLPWSWSARAYGDLLAVAGGKERIRHFAGTLPAHGRPADLEALVADLHEEKTRRYAALARSGAMPLRPGVERLLGEALRAGLVLAIATTTSAPNVTALLEGTLGRAAARWFAVVGAGDVVPAKKPAPDIYHHVLDRLGLPPAACLAFEDSGNGLRAALGAGVATVVTPTDYTRGQDRSGAALVVEDLGEPGRPGRVLACAIPLPSRVVVDLALLRTVHASAAPAGAAIRTDP